MQRTGTVALIAGAIVVAVGVGSSAAPAVRFGAQRERILDTHDVVLTLRNNSDRRIELFGGTVRDTRKDELQVRLEAERRFLPPDAAHSWTWVHEGDAGRFVARFRTDAGTFTDRFELGAYFRIAFRCEDTPESDCAPVDPFVIWVREERPIRQLRNDLQQPASDRRIVSGIVRRAKLYNPEWSYTMGPASIVLGEVFIEVCDAHPSYVEEHRKDWMGERWCPWSSFVESEGK